MDAIAAVTQADPYPYYAELAGRTTGGRAGPEGAAGAKAPGLLHDARLALWIAASPAAVAAVLGHPACRVRPVAEPVPAAIAAGCAGQVFGALVRMTDGERHAAPRLALQRALAQLETDAVHACAVRVAALLKTDRTGRDPAALSAWTFAVPVTAMASLLGFPDEQLPQVAAWMGAFVACLSPLSSAAQVARAHDAALALLDSLKALLQSSAPRRGSLLAGVLAEARAAGWTNAHAILANLVGLLSQTYEATAGLIGNSIVALMRAPGQAALPPADLVAQVLRNDPPIQNTRRFTAHGVELCGVRIEAGQTILVLLAGAGQPFGHGVHACPGQALSHTIAAAALGVLLRNGPPATMAWRYRPSVNARIPEFIPQAA